MPRALWVAVLVIAAVALGAGFFRADRTAAAYEQRAQAAEALARALRVDADLERDRANRFAALAAEQDTVIVYARSDIAAVDASNPPPPDCAPNLAARDSLIGLQGRRIVLGDSVAIARGRALVSLQAAYDTVANVLAARPRPSRWHGPSVGVGAFVGMCADGPCVGVGVTVNAFGRKTS